MPSSSLSHHHVMHLQLKTEHPTVTTITTTIIIHHHNHHPISENSRGRSLTGRTAVRTTYYTHRAKLLVTSRKEKEKENRKENKQNTTKQNIAQSM